MTCGGATVCMSIKFNLTPRRHTLSDFRQLRHRPRASSHFRWRSRQVRQPVRVLLAFVSASVDAFLRVALGVRGELLCRLIGVPSESPIGDWDSDWARLLFRFIFIDQICRVLSYVLISSAGRGDQLRSWRIESRWAKSFDRFHSNGHIRYPHGESNNARIGARGK